MVIKAITIAKAASKLHWLPEKQKFYANKYGV